MPPNPRVATTSLALIVAIAWTAIPATTAEARFRDPRIVNGVTTDGHPAVGALVSNSQLGDDPAEAITEDTMGHECTVTLIGCKTVLTAAHCGESIEVTDRFKVFFQNAGFFDVQSINRHPSYIDGSLLDADVAVFTLKSEVEGIAPAGLNTANPYDFITESLNPNGTIVGFGTTGDGATNSGIKRAGGVVLEPCDPGNDLLDDQDLLCFTYDDEDAGAAGTDSNAAPGDSGGPLFANFTGELALSGTTTGGVGNQTAYVSVYSYLAFIQEKLGEDSTDTCGAGPEVGGDSASVATVEGYLDADIPEEAFDFEVAADAERLLFVMNGEQPEEGYDIDLYIKQGGNASSEDYDCAWEGASPYAACSFADPASGEWNVLLQRNSGSGGYQLTGTLYGAPQDGLVELDGYEAPEGDAFLYYVLSESGASGTVERIAVDDPERTREELVQIPEEEDKVFGVAVNEELDLMFYTSTVGSPNWSSVWRASLEGVDPARIYEYEHEPNPGEPHSFGAILSIPGPGGDLLWMDIAARRIYMGNADGEDPIYYDFEGLEWLYVGNLYGLGLDEANERALVSEYERDNIFAVTPAGDISIWMDEESNPSLSEPTAIAVNKRDGKVYWTQEGASAGVWRSDLDGQNPEMLYAGANSYGQGGLVLDLNGETVYWSEWNSRRINYAALDGSGEKETFKSFPSGYSPKGLAIAYIPTPEPGALASAMAALLCIGFLRKRKNPAS